MKTNKLKKQFVRQHDLSDCGVACLLSIAHYYGGEFSLEQLRIWSGTNAGGTSILGVTEAAKKMGLDAVAYEASIESLGYIDTPMILRVLIDGDLWHYIVFYGWEGEWMRIGDPARGIRLIKPKELAEIWQPAFCVKLELTEEFVRKEALQKSKKKWLIALLKQDYPLLFISIILGMAIAVLGMVMPVYTQQLIDQILPNGDTHRLFWGSFTVFLLLATRIFFSQLREMLLLHQRTDFNKRLIQSFYQSLLHLPKTFFKNRKLGDLLARLNDAGQIQKIIGIIAGTTVIDSLLVIVAFVFIYYYSPLAMLLSFLIIPLFALAVYMFYKDLLGRQKKVVRSYAQTESHYISSMQGIAVIKNSQKEAYFAAANELIYGRYQEAIFLLGKLNIRLSFLIGGMSLVLMMCVLTQLCCEVLLGNLALGELAAVLSMLGLLFPAVARLALLPVSLNEVMVIFDRMYEYGTMPQEQKGGKQIPKTFESLKIKTLSFRFPGSKALLKEINFEIQQQECVAIVGRSGSGKSTLLALIQSFITYKEGQVCINNKYALNELALADWRKIYAVVPQDISVFNGSLWYNICFDEAGKDELAFRAFVRKYGFQKFLSRFPQSYHTILGEGAQQLSGGELQLLAVMRALYKQPQLLLLDEFSAAMDEETERFMLDLLQKLKREMAIIVVTHRLYLLPLIADQVYEMKNGQLHKNKS